MERIKEHIKKHKVLICCYLCIVCVTSIAVIIMYNSKIQEAMLYPKNVIRVKDGVSAPDNYIILTENTKIEQRITMVSKSFTGFSLWFEKNKTDEESEILVRLLNSSRDTVESWKFNTNDIIGNEFFNFYLPKIDVNVGDFYFIIIEGDSDDEMAVPMGIAAQSFYMKNDMFSEMKVKGQARADRIEGDYLLDYQILEGGCESLKYFYFLIVAIIFFLFIITYILFISIQKKESFFVIIAFLIGCLYILIIPPYSAPDEGVHFITAYAQSSGILGREIEDKNGNVIFEPDGATFFVRKDCPDKSSYVTYIRGIFNKEVDVIQHDVSSRKSLNRKNLAYVPQVLGLILGRLLNVNGIKLFLFGRIMALLFYCFLMFWSIRLIPSFGKNILFVVGLLPMTMQQVISYNYDSVLFGISFFAISYILYLAFDSTKEKIVLRDYIILGLVIIVIVPIKFIYIILLGLGLLIPKEKFGNTKNKIISAFFTIILSLGVLCLVRWGLIENAVSTGVETGLRTYNLADCIKNPVEIFVIFFKTMELNSTFYLQSMIGTPLGWLEITVPNIIVYGFALLLVCSFLEPLEGKQWKKIERIWILILVGGIGILVFLALLLDGTYLGAEIIEGVQGRYFIPILPLFLCALQNQRVILKEKIDTFLIGGLLVLQVTTVLRVVSVVAVR